MWRREEWASDGKLDRIRLGYDDTDNGMDVPSIGIALLLLQKTDATLCCASPARRPLAGSSWE